MLFEMTQEKKKTKKFSPEFYAKHSCDVCPANQYCDKYKNSRKIIPQHVKADVVILGVQVSRDDDNQGVFGASDEQFFWNVFDLIPNQSEYEKICFVGLTQCATDYLTSEEKTEAILCCRNRIRELIIERNPKTIMTLGGDAFVWLYPDLNRNDHKKFAGKMCNWNSHDDRYVKVIPNYSLREISEERSEERKKQLTVIETGANHFWQKVFDDKRDVVPFIQDPMGNVHIDFDESKAKIKEWEKRITAGDVIVIDLETNGLRPYLSNSEMLTAAFTFEGVSISFPIYCVKPNITEGLKLLYDFMKLLYFKNVSIMGHNIEFECSWLTVFLGDWVLDMRWQDTMIYAYVLGYRTDDKYGGTLSLDNLVRTIMDFALKDYSKLDRSRLKDYDPEQVMYYNALDTKYTHFLGEILVYRLFEFHDSEKNLIVVEHHETTTRSLVNAYLEGLPVDKELLETYETGLRVKVFELKDKIINGFPGKIFSRNKGKLIKPGSPQDVGFVLEKMGVHLEEGTAESHLNEALKTRNIDDEPKQFILDILEHRKSEKLLDSYIKPLSVLMSDSEDGLCHPSYNSKFTRTARLSAENPAIQTWPSRRDKWLRKVIKSKRKYILVAIDFASIEVRVIAAQTGDKKLLFDLVNGFDMHGHYAKILILIAAYGKEFFDNWKSGRNMDDMLSEEVIKECLTRSQNFIIKLAIDDMGIDPSNHSALFKAIRFIAKNRWVFPSFYGSHFLSKGKTLNMRSEYAEQLDALFWLDYPGVKSWQENTITHYVEKGFIETLTGRIFSFGFNMPMSIRDLYNWPIQSTASDIVIDAGNRLFDEDFRWNINVHDDLTFSLPDDEALESTIIDISEIMSDCPYSFMKEIPLGVEVSTGKQWGEMKDYGEFFSDKGWTKFED